MSQNMLVYVLHLTQAAEDTVLDGSHLTSLHLARANSLSLISNYTLITGEMPLLMMNIYNVHEHQLIHSIAIKINIFDKSTMDINIV